MTALVTADSPDIVASNSNSKDIEEQEAKRESGTLYRVRRIDGRWKSTVLMAFQ
jgi:hypothetical protein